jgi:hypothetical protein
MKGTKVANASGTYGARAADSGDGLSEPRQSRPSTYGQPLPPELSPRKNTPERRPAPTAELGSAPVAGRRPGPRVVVGDPADSTGARLHHASPAAIQRSRTAAAAQQEPEYGLPGWGALLVLIGISSVGALIDTISGTQARGGFNIGIVGASIAAILIVRRSAMFPVVVVPPIVYSIASGILLYARSNGLHDRKVLIDTAANWLVYGFPAIAAATASVLIIAGIRLLTRR